MNVPEKLLVFKFDSREEANRFAIDYAQIYQD